jgi:membrane protein CcdC involved in cytochrome C biogenesis
MISPKGVGHTLNLTTIIIVIAAASLIIWRRTRAMYKPIKGTGKNMLFPLLIFIVGFSGFMNPDLHFTETEVFGTLILGILFAIPMIMTTNYEVREDGEIYAVRSKAFIFALVGLLVIRLVLKNYISGVDPVTLGMLFFLLAVSYVVPWRVACYLKFKKALTLKESMQAVSL